MVDILMRVLLYLVSGDTLTNIFAGGTNFLPTDLFRRGGPPSPAPARSVTGLTQDSY